MPAIEKDFECEDIHPIDIVQNLAEEKDWDFDRIGENQIAMTIESRWRTYSVTLTYSAHDEALRIVCAFEMSPPARRRSAINDLIVKINDRCWLGAFVIWRDQKITAYRYSLNLAGGAEASVTQINDMVRSAVMVCERFYPAFQLVGWSGESPEKALQIAIDEAYGRA